VFCFNCGRPLQKCYIEIEDPIGNIHKIHKTCKDDLVESFTQTKYKTPFELENPELFIESVEDI
jgi:hypothetical protein